MSKEVEISETPDPSLKDRIMLQGKKIKGHVEKNKWVYIGGVVVILSRGYFKPTTVNVADVIANIRPVGVLSKQNVTTNIVKIYSDRLGRPGNFCHLAGRPEIGYASQSEAAKIFGVTDKVISQHLNGHLPEIKGGYRLVRPVV